MFTVTSPNALGALICLALLAAVWLYGTGHYRLIPQVPGLIHDYYWYNRRTRAQLRLIEGNPQLLKVIQEQMAWREKNGITLTWSPRLAVSHAV